MRCPNCDREYMQLIDFKKVLLYAFKREQIPNKILARNRFRRYVNANPPGMKNGDCLPVLPEEVLSELNGKKEFQRDEQVFSPLVIDGRHFHDIQGRKFFISYENLVRKVQEALAHPDVSGYLSALEIKNNKDALVKDLMPNLPKFFENGILKYQLPNKDFSIFLNDYYYKNSRGCEKIIIESSNHLGKINPLVIASFSYHGLR